MDVAVVCLSIIFFLRKALNISRCQPWRCKGRHKIRFGQTIYLCKASLLWFRERSRDLCIEFWLYQYAKLTLYSAKTLFRLVDSVTPQLPQCGQAEAPAIISSLVRYNYPFSENRALNSEPAPSWGMPEHQQTNYAASHLVANSYSNAMCTYQLCVTLFYDTPYFEPMFCPHIFVVYISNFGRLLHMPSWSKTVIKQNSLFLLKVFFSYASIIERVTVVWMYQMYRCKKALYIIEILWYSIAWTVSVAEKHVCYQYVNHVHSSIGIIADGSLGSTAFVAANKKCYIPVASLADKQWIISSRQCVESSCTLSAGPSRGLKWALSTTLLYSNLVCGIRLAVPGLTGQSVHTIGPASRAIGNANGTSESLKSFNNAFCCP